MLSDEVQERIAELGLDQSITPYVIEELRRIQEAKSIGSAKGRIDPEKQRDISTVQSGTRFVSSLRAHARQARKQLDSLVSELNDSILDLIKQYRTRKVILDKKGKPILDKQGKPVYGDRKIGFPKLSTRTKLLLKITTEQAFKLGVKSAGIVQANGTLYPLTAHESKWLASYLREETRYWSKFLTDLRKGQSDKRTIQRVGRFAESIRSVFESGRVLSVGPDVIIHWVLESGNPCPDCTLLHKYSPYTSDTLPTTPKAGSTRCLSYCYCTLRIVKTSRKEVDKVRRHVKSKSWVLKKIQQQRKKRK